jgi:hypothetical protein
MSPQFTDDERDSLVMDIFSHGKNVMVINGVFRQVVDMSILMHGNTTSPVTKESYLTNTVSVPKPDHMSVRLKLRRLPPGITHSSSFIRGDSIEIFNNKHHITIHNPRVQEVENTNYDTVTASNEKSNCKMKIIATNYSVEKNWHEHITK